MSEVGAGASWLGICFGGGSEGAVKAMSSGVAFSVVGWAGKGDGEKARPCPWDRRRRRRRRRARWLPMHQTLSRPASRKKRSWTKRPHPRPQPSSPAAWFSPGGSETRPRESMNTWVNSLGDATSTDRRGGGQETRGERRGGRTMKERETHLDVVRGHVEL